MRAIAVDWSGRAFGVGRHIWLAEADGGALTRLQDGRDRERMGDELVAAALAGPDLVVGLDFAFSFPLGFLDRLGVDSGLEVPPALAESWLETCPPPFWGRPGRPRGPEPQLRQTEHDLREQLGLRPKSIFQIGGAGAVGTGSLRGIALLARLRAEGFAIWPFDPPRPPMAVEIYPRLFTGPLVKARPSAREAYTRAHGLTVAAAVSEDALDAAVSALAMERWAAAPSVDAWPVGPVAAREGWIADFGRSSRGRPRGV